MAYREKYKALILKYVPYVLKYMACIFYNKPCVFFQCPKRGETDAVFVKRIGH